MLKTLRVQTDLGKYRKKYSKSGLTASSVSHPRKKGLWQMLILENANQESKGKTEKEGEQVSGSDNKWATVWHQIKLTTGFCGSVL